MAPKNLTITMYALVYPDEQEVVAVTLAQARKIASDFIGHNVEHLTVGGSRKTYTVKESLFDPTRGIVVTTTTGETFVHVGLKKPTKRTSPPRVGAKKKATKPRKRGRPRKQTSAPKPLADIGIPESKVRTGIVAMFKAGMAIKQVADIFKVENEAIERVIREWL